MLLHSSGAKHREEQENHREHEKDQDEGVFPFALGALVLILAVRSTKLFLKRDRSCADSAVPVLWN